MYFGAFFGGGELSPATAYAYLSTRLQTLTQNFRRRRAVTCWSRSGHSDWSWTGSEPIRCRIHLRTSSRRRRTRYMGRQSSVPATPQTPSRISINWFASASCDTRNSLHVTFIHCVINNLPTFLCWPHSLCSDAGRLQRDWLTTATRDAIHLVIITTTAWEIPGAKNRLMTHVENAESAELKPILLLLFTPRALRS